MKTVSNTMSIPACGGGAVDPNIPCFDCGVRARAVCSSLSNAELSDLSQVNRHRKFSSGDCVFFEGDPADSFFVVMGGSLKLYKLMADGRRQVTGFLFRGDMIGAAYQQDADVTAEALEDTRLCQMPRERVEQIADDSNPLGRRLLEIATKGVASAHEQMLLLGRKTAQERLASFLIWLSAKAEERGEDRDRLAVPMSRTDMGDYLGLTVETVSRTMTKLKNAGIISLEDRGVIHVRDWDRLEDAAAI